MKSQPWIFVIITCSNFLHLCSMVESFPVTDKIVRLPGQPHVTFQQFSGYIPVDENKQRALFYYFVEAETNPASKPLLLWLNGGPGCSSIGVGAFTEHGPFITNEKTLVKNEYSWNKEANLLYLESPAGVGFSYSTNNSFYSYINDEITAQDSLVFLQRWFLKFPEYKNRDLYISGESYAGHYVPQLAQLIIESKVNFNLKGIAIGNPLLEFSTDFNSQDDYFWSHGLLSDSAYKLLKTVCNSSRSRLQILKPEHHLQQDATNDKKVTNKGDACILKNAETYLNRKDVQKALHAQLVRVNRWEVCSKVVNYDPLNKEIPTINIVGLLVKSGIRVIVYSGDLDSVIPFTGTRSLVDGLAKKLGLKTTVPYSAWFVDKQVGGWTQAYGDHLSYATVRGASHGAPTTQPKRSLVLFTSFLAGKPLPRP
ncbi:Carboxypeptidase [Quillaja saponaria]|uniref:Carboxypeptidase n=1 Tax=Quillaja saponaria TaxID=32244 RepID=A0AAD7Q887_QUISA|nr:Carboxypeptidase [Quillaja saponaria]